MSKDQNIESDERSGRVSAWVIIIALAALVALAP